jgi:DNA-directed RNA polymerase specialized sigma24 family protein
VTASGRPPPFDLGEAEHLVAKAAAGDSGSFNALVQLIWPDLTRTVRGSRRLAAAGADEDGPHDVGLRIIEKLRADDFRALRLYADWHQRHPEKSLLDWLRIVAANVTRDYLRELRGYASSEDLPSPKQLMNAYSAVISSDDLGTRPPMTWAQTARQLIEFARARLDTSQVRALEEWLKGSSFDEIAKPLDGDPENARRTVRAALAVLRREFGKS